MTHTVDLDTETTGLEHRDAHMWEIALIVENHPDPTFDGEHHVMFPDVPLRHATPEALRVGGFFERASALRGRGLVAAWLTPYPRYTVTQETVGSQRLHNVAHGDTAAFIAAAVAGATVAGCRPEFDKPFIEDYLLTYGQVWAARHHTIDVAQVTYGRLGMTTADLPYRSDDLAAAFGVPAPSGDERHTALGDARWARRWRERLDEQARWSEVVEA